MFFCSKSQKEFMVKYQKIRAEKIESSVWSAQSDVLFGQSFGASSCYKRGEKKRLKVHCTLIAILKALSFTKHCKLLSGRELNHPANCHEFRPNFQACSYHGNLLKSSEHFENAVRCQKRM